MNDQDTPNQEVLEQALNAEQLAYMRELAEEGRMQPLQGGKYLVLWGALSCFGLTFMTLQIGNIVSFPPLSFFIVRSFVMVVGVFFSRKWGKEAACTTVANSVGNKVEAMVWSIGGGVLGLISMSIFAIVYFQAARFEALGVDARILFGMISPIAFGVYAIALASTAVAARADWLWRYVVLSFVFSALSLAFVWDIKQHLIAILGVIVVSIVPGMIMLRKNKEAEAGSEA